MGVLLGHQQAPCPRRVLCTAVVLVGVMLGSCRTPTPHAKEFRQVQTKGPCTATLVIKPYPPITMQKAHLALHLASDSGHPISGAQVSYDLTMPDCVAMPLNRPRAAEGADGAYEATAVFTMAGYWQARVQVSEVDGVQEFVFFLKVR